MWIYYTVPQFFALDWKLRDSDFIFFRDQLENTVWSVNYGLSGNFWKPPAGFRIFLLKKDLNKKIILIKKFGNMPETAAPGSGGFQQVLDNPSLTDHTVYIYLRLSHLFFLSAWAFLARKVSQFLGSISWFLNEVFILYIFYHSSFFLDDVLCASKVEDKKLGWGGNWTESIELGKDSYRDGRNTPHWSLKIWNQ